MSPLPQPAASAASDPQLDSPLAPPVPEEAGGAATTAVLAAEDGLRAEDGTAAPSSGVADGRGPAVEATNPRGGGIADGAAEGDPVLEALEQMDEQIEANLQDERTLQRRIRRLRDARRQGQSWRAILDTEPEPGTLSLIGQILARVSASSGVLRRALARALRGEGETVPGIGRRFGVTHQRVSNLLRPPRAERR